MSTENNVSLTTVSNEELKTGLIPLLSQFSKYNTGQNYPI